MYSLNFEIGSIQGRVVDHSSIFNGSSDMRLIIIVRQERNSG